MTGLVNGFGNYSSPDREPNDYYATHPSAARALLGVERFSPAVMEPACGAGHIVGVLREAGYEVAASDLVPRGCGEERDFFDVSDAGGMDVVTNPPFKCQERFARHALSILRPGGKLALLLKVQFLEGVRRRALFEEAPPARVHVFSRRARVAKGGDFSGIGSALACYAWFVWEKGFAGRPELDWIDPVPCGHGEEGGRYGLRG